MSLLPEQFTDLSTPRLLLRAITPSDNNAIFSLLSDPDVMRYHNLKPFATLEQADVFIQKVTDQFLRGEAIRWGITRHEHEPVIGTCGFTSILSSNLCGRIGYELQQLFWGNGIMSEALTAIISFGFTTLQLHRIEAFVMLGNVASDRTLTRLGFAEEGILRDYGIGREDFGVSVVSLYLNQTGATKSTVFKVEKR